MSENSAPKPNFDETVKGEYTYSNGNRYVGDIRDREFHGNGTLYFTNGAKWEGSFENNRATTGTYTFSDGLKFDENEESWKYCTNASNDRRFNTETNKGMKAAGRSNCTSQGAAQKIPENAYDVGDGYYIPGERTIYTYDGRWKRTATDDEHDWIVKYCRKGWDETVGVSSGWRMNQ